MLWAKTNQLNALTTENTVKRVYSETAKWPLAWFWTNLSQCHNHGKIYSSHVFSSDLDPRHFLDLLQSWHLFTVTFCTAIEIFTRIPFSESHWSKVDIQDSTVVSYYSDWTGFANPMCITCSYRRIALTFWRISTISRYV